MSSDLVKVEQRDSVQIITLNRAEAKNAINREMAVAVAAAVDQLDDDPALSVGILTGAAGVFSAGMDLKAFLKGEMPIIDERGLAGITETPPQKVLIAAVDGFALAGGCELALACDLIVASRGAAFGVPEVKRGLVCAGGGLTHLPRRIPRGLALEIILTGDPVSAERAYEIGLVNPLCDGPAVDAALDLATTIARNAPLAVQASKRVVRASQDWSVDDLFERQKELVAPVFTSTDAQEGAAAFAEKRPPRWQGA